MNDPDSDELPTRLDTLIGATSPSGIEGEEDWTNPDLGPFRLLRVLGRGGMGQVYLARQVEPVERDVALKLIQHKVRNASTLARFEIERQALAQMSHPAIAQVFDAGTTPNGYPYFAMEYVDGLRLDLYCRKHRLTLGQRLELMIRVCNGVQHAHQRGIIHRDLKPANILVVLIDGEPRPKIIDFGIATATQDSESGRVSRDIVGTPQYMSPEQFDLEQGLLDPRSDVYSLGVILHELLIDRPPIEGGRLSDVDSRTLKKVFADHHPLPAPSTLLGVQPDQARRLAEQRQTSVRHLRRRLRRDIDAIVLKALAQSPDQRYASPGELADDLRRALGHYPVQAVQPSRTYLFSRFARRHALGLGSASAVLLALIAGLTAATIGMLEAQRQYRLAEQRQQELEQVSGFQQAMLESIEAQSMGLSMLTTLREQVRSGLDERQGESTGSVGMDQLEALLQPVNAADLAREVLDQQLLTRARESIDLEFIDQPLLRADLQRSIAQVYRAIGRREALPSISAQVLELRRSRLPENHPDVLAARGDHAYALYAINRLDEARGLLEALITDVESMAPDEHSLLIESRIDLAIVLVDQGQLDQARELALVTLDQARDRLGPGHRQTFAAESQTGYVLARGGQLEQALEHFRAALDGFRQIEGPTSQATLRAMTNVSAALGALGRFEEALAIEEELLDLLVDTVGWRHIHSIRTMGNMANNLRRVGDSARALELLSEAERISEALLGPLDPVTLRARLNLGSLLTYQGELERGLALLDRVIADRRTTLGPSHPETLSAEEVRTSNLIDQERYAEALAQIEPVIEGRLSHFGDQHPLTINSYWLRGVALRRSGQPERAVGDMAKVIDSELERRPDSTELLNRALTYYGTLLEAGLSAQAATLREQVFAALEAARPEELDQERAEIRRALETLASQS